MGILDSLKRMTRPYDEDDDEFHDFTPTPREVPPAPKTTGQARSDYAGFERPTATEKNKVVSIHATAQFEVFFAKPERFEAVSDVADQLRERHTVVLNLEQTSKDVSRRILDFLSGVAYAQDGKIKRVAVSTYLITPYNVGLLGDLLDELENTGLYF
ncbi:MAG: cell division protein SepF [Oscillospiraceae bacterium]|jgi:cell division inhibitor SepF|nr:cell division protein SepF [Oscillospiraceae bacterium]